MKEITDRILKYLNNENIKVHNFQITNPDKKEKLVEISLVIKNDDIEKWEYLLSRVKQKAHKTILIDCIYMNGFFNISILRKESDEDALYKTLETFLEYLERKLYTVNPKVKKITAIVKPTHRCNLDCKFCYDKPHRERIKNDISLDTLERFIYLLSQYAEEVDFTWHGGEPTLMGLDWYKKVHSEIFPKYPMTDFQFGIMSNGVVFNQDWFDFFKQYSIKPAMSYQAYYQSDLRCSNQVNQNKEKDLKLSEKLAKTLEEHADVLGIIDVVTKTNYKHQIEIYEFYKKIGCRVCLNHIQNVEQTKKNDLDLSAEEYSREFLKFFKYWLFDKDGVYERTAATMLNIVIGSRKVLCTYSKCRHKWISINPLGDLYPCGRHYPDNYKIGNIMEIDDIAEAFRSEAYEMLINESEIRYKNTCEKCNYKEFCKGGCNASSIEVYQNAKTVNNFTCNYFKMQFDGIYDMLRDIDINNSNLNPIARKILVDNGFYSVSEIKAFIKNFGIDVELEYNPDNLFECSEYKVFRAINYIKDGSIKHPRHIDFIDGYDENKLIKLRNEKARQKDLFDYFESVGKLAVNR